MKHPSVSKRFAQLDVVLKFVSSELVQNHYHEALNLYKSDDFEYKQKYDLWLVYAIDTWLDEVRQFKNLRGQVPRN
jgi:hypothetical protein